jgi:hypothetical protein
LKSQRKQHVAASSRANGGISASAWRSAPFNMCCSWRYHNTSASAASQALINAGVIMYRWRRHNLQWR